MDSIDPMVLAGAASLIACLVFVYLRTHLKHQVAEMWAVDHYTARELRMMCSDGFNAVVEIDGTISCPSPITSPAAAVPCCWYRTTVERQLRKTRHRNNRVETYYEWSQSFDQTRGTIFHVHDDTGHTLVDPLIYPHQGGNGLSAFFRCKEAKIDSEVLRSETVSWREPWFEQTSHSDTGKYRIKEIGLRPEGYVYVLGQATAQDDGTTSPPVVIHYPDQGYMEPNKRFFIISRKSEEELTRSLMHMKALWFWLSVLALIASMFFFAAAAGIL